MSQMFRTLTACYRIVSNKDPPPPGYNNAKPIRQWTQRPSEFGKLDSINASKIDVNQCQNCIVKATKYQHWLCQSKAELNSTSV